MPTFIVLHIVNTILDVPKYFLFFISDNFLAVEDVTSFLRESNSLSFLRSRHSVFEETAEVLISPFLIHFWKCCPCTKERLYDMCILHARNKCNFSHHLFALKLSTLVECSHAAFYEFMMLFTFLSEFEISWSLMLSLYGKEQLEHSPKTSLFWFHRRRKKKKQVYHLRL